ncbi:MAG: paraquat-inducible protein A [Roseibacillus sp.]
MAERSKGWPRAKRASKYAACDYCDTLQKVVALREGESAHCNTCGAELYENRPYSLQRTVSFSLSALFLMVLVVLFPFLSLDNNGLKSSMTVWGAAGSLWAQGDIAIAVATAAFIVVLPVMLVSCLLYVTFPLIFGRCLTGAVVAFRAVSHLQTWVMVEVFFLGAIVSLLKLVKLAEVSLGQGFWAFALLVVMIAGALSSIDKVEFWDRIEAAREREKEVDA